MSYCRWSSMNFKCDIFAYESADGFEVHVAKRHHNPDPSGLGELIGLPHDGEHSIYDTEDEMLEAIADLARVGYTVPPSLLEVDQ